jgi:hypothetical protein
MRNGKLKRKRTEKRGRLEKGEMRRGRRENTGKDAVLCWTLQQCEKTEPVVIVAIWRINREVVHGQSGVGGEAAPMLHVFSSYRQRTC